jgi:hypothetical protein
MKNGSYSFAKWIAELIAQDIDEVSIETNRTTGRCEVIVDFPNGDKATLLVRMEDDQGRLKK